MNQVFIDPLQYGTIDAVLSGASQLTNISVDTIKSKTRKREVSEIRQVVMWLSCREDEVTKRPQRFGPPKKITNVQKHTSLSLTAIGIELGGRNHATIIHGRDYIQHLYETRYEHPERLNKREKELLNMALHLDHKLKLAQIDYEKIKSRGTSEPQHNTEGENGLPEGSHCNPCKPAIWWGPTQSRAIGDSERCGSNNIDNGEGSIQQPGIIETHY